MVCLHLNQVLDLQMLFMDNMGLWYNTNVHRFMSHSAVANLIAGEPPKPIDGVLAGIRDLWRTEASMQEGQEHIRAINQGLVQRLPTIDLGTLRHPSSLPSPPTRRETGKVVLAQTASETGTQQHLPLILQSLLRIHWLRCLVLYFLLPKPKKCNGARRANSHGDMMMSKSSRPISGKTEASPVLSNKEGSLGSGTLSDQEPRDRFRPIVRLITIYIQKLP